MTQVYIHGLGQTPASWGPLLERLDAPPERVCPDLTELVSAGAAVYPALFRAFARYCDGLEGPLALCGLSLGGVLALSHGGENFYDGWMKNPRSAMLSCSDGFRPVSFLVEALDEDAE